MTSSRLLSVAFLYTDALGGRRWRKRNGLRVVRPTHLSSPVRLARKRSQVAAMAIDEIYGTSGRDVVLRICDSVHT